MFSLNYRELWAGTSQWLTDELDQMAASAQTKWFTQHKGDGTHGDITATSVHAGQLTTGVYRYDPVVDNCWGVDRPGTVLRVPAGVSTVYIDFTDASSALYWGLYGIDMDGATEGTVVHVVLRTSSSRYIINSAHTATTGAGLVYPLIGNRFALDQRNNSVISLDGSQPSMYVSNTYTGVTLVRVNDYDYESSPAGQCYPAWVQVG